MKKFLSLLLLVTLLASLAVGCNQGGDADGDDDSTPDNEAAGDPVEIVLWEQADPNVDALMDEMINNFTTENPNITVTRTHYETEELRNTFLSSAVAGEGPDLIYGPSDNIGVFTDGNLIKPVTDVVNADLLGTIDENALNDGKMNDQQWSVPDINGNQIALLYNKAMVAEAPKTWEELVETAKANKKGEDVYGFTYNEKEPFWFVGFYNAMGGSVMDENSNPTLDNEAMANALQFALDIRKEHGLGVEGQDYDIPNGLFKEGKSAMILNGAWSWNEYKEAGVDLGIAPMPLPDGKNAIFMSSTRGYSISASMDDAKKDAVNTFFEFLLKPENNAQFALKNSQAPAVTAARDLDEIKNDELQQVAIATIENTVPMPIVPEMRIIWDTIRPELEAVLYSGKAPADAAKAMQEAATAAVEELRAE